MSRGHRALAPRRTESRQRCGNCRCSPCQPTTTTKIAIKIQVATSSHCIRGRRRRTTRAGGSGCGGGAGRASRCIGITSASPRIRWPSAHSTYQLGADVVGNATNRPRASRDGSERTRLEPPRRGNRWVRAARGAPGRATKRPRASRGGSVRAAAAIPVVSVIGHSLLRSACRNRELPSLHFDKSGSVRVCRSVVT